MPDYGDVFEELRATKERHLIRSLKPRYWFSRAIVYVQNLVMAIAAMIETRSLVWQAVVGQNGWGWLVLAFIVSCCVFGLADVLINDMLPKRYTFVSGLYWRHMTLLGIAMGLSTMCVLITFRFGYTVILIVYWTNAMIAVALAFMDVFARYPRRLDRCDI